MEIRGADGVRAEATAPAEDSASALNRDILDLLTTLVKRSGPIWDSLAAGFGLAAPDLLAMYKMEDAIAMKDLAQRMGCDASFITSIADKLEVRGYVHREPSKRDRRVKNLVMTDEGMAAKNRLTAELADRMPWCYALNEEERMGLRALLRKILNTTPPEGCPGGGAEAAM